MNKALAILEVGNKVEIGNKYTKRILWSHVNSEIVNLAMDRTKGEKVIITLKSGAVITLKSWGILESELDAAEAARAKTEAKRK